MSRSFRKLLHPQIKSHFRYRMKAEGTCKQGERSDLTGCTPASGDVGSSDEGVTGDTSKKPKKVAAKQRKLKTPISGEKDPKKWLSSYVFGVEGESAEGKATEEVSGLPSDEVIQSLSKYTPKEAIVLYRYVKDETGSGSTGQELRSWTRSAEFADALLEANDEKGKVIKKKFYPDEILVDTTMLPEDEFGEDVIISGQQEVIVAYGNTLKRMKKIRSGNNTPPSVPPSPFRGKSLLLPSCPHCEHSLISDGTYLFCTGPSCSWSETSSEHVKSLDYEVKEYIERKDKLGRRMCYNNGVRVACGGAKKPTPKAPKAKPSPVAKKAKADKQAEKQKREQEYQAAYQKAESAAKLVAKDPSKATAEQIKTIGDALVAMKVPELNKLKKLLNVKVTGTKQKTIDAIKKQALNKAGQKPPPPQPIPPPVAQPKPAPAPQPKPPEQQKPVPPPAPVQKPNPPPQPIVIKPGPPTPPVPIPKPPAPQPEKKPEEQKAKINIPQAAKVDPNSTIGKILAGDAEGRKMVEDFANNAPTIPTELAEMNAIVERSYWKAKDAMARNDAKDYDKYKQRYDSYKEFMAVKIDQYSEESRKSFISQFTLKDPAIVRVKVASGSFQQRGMDSLKKGMNFMAKLVGKNLMSEVKLTVEPIPEDGRAHYTNGRVRINENTEAAVVAHEAGHHLNEDPRVKKLCADFLEARLKGQPPQKLKALFPNSKFGDDEEGNKDDFDKAFQSLSAAAPYYVGKIYKGGQTEVISMGIEMLYRDPATFARADPEFFQFVTGVVSGRLLK